VRDPFRRGSDEILRLLTLLFRLCESRLEDSHRLEAFSG
jgi:hypothetical protein